jgi:aryl-alcohol dehydrogenase-like predicted oxidoreductase
MSRIGLGTVQFSANYGISNRSGRPSEAEVAAILARATETEVGYLDTAPSYADAEALIGRHLSSGHRINIVTKLPPLEDDTIAPSHTQVILRALSASLERLRVPRVHGLLIHRARDLAKPGWQYLVDALHEAQSRDLTACVGASVYDEDDLALVESRLRPDIIQLPINALDRRLACSGWLTRLHTAGIKIHARSLFLQGLLLMDPAVIPEFFTPVRATLAKLHAAWTAKKLTPLEACLRYVLHTANVDVAIVGVNRLQELKEIEAVVMRLTNESDELEFPAEIDPTYLDPRRWRIDTR